MKTLLRRLPRIALRPSLVLRIAVLVSAASLTGCATPGLFSNFTQRSSAEAQIDAAGNSQRLSGYLSMMGRLVQGDPLTQAETFREVESAAQISPTPVNRLKLALALGTPGHPKSDPQRAANMLNGLLASDTTLSSDERTLAMVNLEEIQQRLNLDAETGRLKKQAADQLAAQSTASKQRLEAAQAENEKLRKQLDEANKKLNAITNIERSIRERENGANSN